VVEEALQARRRHRRQPDPRLPDNKKLLFATLPLKSMNGVNAKLVEDLVDNPCQTGSEIGYAFTEVNP
jgi:hypothetical protein